MNELIIAYQEKVEKEKTDAKIALDDFFSLDINEYKDDHSPEGQIIDIINWHSDMMFFKNDLLINKLKKLVKKKANFGGSKGDTKMHGSIYPINHKTNIEDTAG